MRILVINWQDIKNPYGGGAELHLQKIFSRIADKGHHVDLICCEFDGCKKNEQIDGINVFRKGNRNTFNFNVPNIYKQFSCNSYDIVIDDINKIPFYTPLYVKEPVLAISHHFFGSSIFRETNPVFGSYVYIAEKFVDFIYKKTPFAVVSKSTLDEFLNRGFSKDLFNIVQNAIDHSDFPMSVGNKYQNPTITYFGRLKKYKSIDHLIKAFASLVKLDSSCNSNLLIMGTGDYRPDLEKLTNEMGISDRTQFLGFVDDNTKKEVLGRSWCVVNTSMKEGWGITNIEANACGTPVLSANVPGLKDSVKNGFSGLLYEYGDISDLANKIALLFNNQLLRTELSINAVEWARSMSWDDSASKMLELCERVIKNKKSP